MADERAPVRKHRSVKMTPAFRAKIRGISEDPNLTEHQKAEAREAAFTAERNRAGRS